MYVIYRRYHTKVIDHYEPEIQDLDDNVVELDKFRDNIWFGREK